MELNGVKKNGWLRAVRSQEVQLNEQLIVPLVVFGTTQWTTTEGMWKDLVGERCIDLTYDCDTKSVSILLDLELALFDR